MLTTEPAVVQLAERAGDLPNMRYRAHHREGQPQRCELAVAPDIRRVTANSDHDCAGLTMLPGCCVSVLVQQLGWQLWFRKLASG
jgi:hypothetical protein